MDGESPVSAAMPETVSRNERCGNCGRLNRPTTVVLDFSPVLVCDDCIASFDWSGWIFDPVLNSYTHP